ncbi:hypothetical protein Ciccas_006319 [Cichlidogyrus casuarinus]|uniref:Uncharacterized protein n=1 Tax=Cichlidogyrus casuarinus TaxID=1844966 RepID=A0ABD2Q6G8_9PLAT
MSANNPQLAGNMVSPTNDTVAAELSPHVACYLWVIRTFPSLTEMIASSMYHFGLMIVLLGLFVTSGLGVSISPDVLGFAICPCGQQNALNSLDTSIVSSVYKLMLTIE